MRAEKIKALLPHINSKQTGTRGKWIVAPCPFAPWKHGGKDAHPSFGIHSETTKKSICKCLSCGWGGDVIDLVFELRRLLKKSPAHGYDLAKAAEMANGEFDEMELDLDSIPDYEDAVSEAKDVPFPEDFLKMFIPLWKSEVGMNYMMSRGLPLKLLKELNLVFDPAQKRVGFPFRNSAGKLMGVQGRAIDPKEELRYYQYGYLGVRNMQCWLGEDTLNLDKPVVLCEGPLDDAKIRMHYPNVAASFTSGLSVQKLKRLADASEIITFYDYGKGGDAARDKIRKTLSHATIIDIIPTEEEDDAGAMSPAAIRKYLQAHVPLLPQDKWDPLSSYQDN